MISKKTANLILLIFVAVWTALSLLILLLLLLCRDASVALEVEYFLAGLISLILSSLLFLHIYKSKDKQK